MSTAAARKVEILQGHEFFRGLPASAVERLAAHARQSTIPAGHVIFRKGDQGQGLLAVLSGVVKISVASDEEAREVVLNLISADEIFGEIALLDGRPRTADASALTECSLLVLDRRDFLSALAIEPTIAVKLLEVLSARLRRTSEQVEDLTFANASTRLSRILLRLAEVQGVRNTPASRILITQQELGKMVGVSRESINRQLRAWEEAGAVALEKGACRILNWDRLRQIALSASV